MIAVYFSGTGNTQYCVEKFIAYYDNTIQFFALENGISALKIQEETDIIFAYPIYYSNLPKIVSDFINQNPKLWNGKNIFIMATMGLFSSDGAGLSGRLFRRYGASISGGLHVKMPDCICDEKALKRSYAKNSQIVAEADKKIKMAALQLKNGSPAKNGLNFIYHMAGLFGQRLWFYNKTRNYSNKIKFDEAACILCGKCVAACPMKNLCIQENKVISDGRCTMCYRCISQCPRKAVTLLGDKVIEQYTVKDFTRMSSQKEKR